MNGLGTLKGLVVAASLLAVAASTAIAQSSPGVKPAEPAKPTESPKEPTSAKAQESKASPTPASATTAPASSPTSASSPAPQQAATGGASKPDAAPFENYPPRTWGRVQSFKRLRDAVLAKLKLTEEHKKSVQAAFENLFATFREDPSLAAKAAQKPYPAIPDEVLAKMRAEAESAEKGGAKEKAEDIREQIARGTPGTSANLRPFADVIIQEELLKIVPAEFHPELHKVFARWEIVEPSVTRDGLVRQLYRALSDPDLKLSPEQQAHVDAIMKEAFGSMSAGKRTPSAQAEASRKAKEKVLQVLTPEQGKTVEETLAVYAKHDAEKGAYLKWRESHPYLRPRPKTEAERQGPPTPP
ncbi:MAG: hypothetical protein AABZ12_05455 [Planctomycetota bacterium]